MENAGQYASSLLHGLAPRPSKEQKSLYALAVRRKKLSGGSHLPCSALSDSKKLR